MAKVSWHKRNPQEARRLVSKRYYSQYRAVLHTLKSHPCMDCGQTYHPCQMQFDHRPGTEKKFCIGVASRSLANMLAEVEKCDLVCANCHALRTWVTRRK